MVNIIDKQELIPMKSSADTDQLKNLYSEKEKDYFSFSRKIIVDLVPPNKSNKVLDIGCGIGAVLKELKKDGKAAEIVGVDINRIEGAHELDEFLLGDIEEISLPYPQAYFDIIICADVLEHLRDPWNTLRKLISYMKQDGLLLASFPNIREGKTLWKIAFGGDFKYEKSGILDKTHLRFFCKKNIIDLMTLNRLGIVSMHPAMGTKRAIINKVLFGLIEEFLAIQYIVAAQK